MQNQIFLFKINQFKIFDGKFFWKIDSIHLLLVLDSDEK